MASNSVDLPVPFSPTKKQMRLVISRELSDAMGGMLKRVFIPSNNASAKKFNGFEAQHWRRFSLAIMSSAFHESNQNIRMTSGGFIPGEGSLDEAVAFPQHPTEFFRPERRYPNILHAP